MSYERQLALERAGASGLVGRVCHSNKADGIAGGSHDARGGDGRGGVLLENGAGDAVTKGQRIRATFVFFLALMFAVPLGLARAMHMSWSDALFTAFIAWFVQADGVLIASFIAWGGD